jgi:putative DNA primase/helicase
VCETPGYDSQTGYVLIPEIEFPPVPASPTLTDAIDALAELCEPFEEFPFKGEADRMVPVAAVLTLLARPALGDVPAFLTDANTAGAGKTLATDAVSIIATGRPAAKMTWTDDPAELEKVLASFALAGVPVVAFDNVTGAFGGAALDKVLTSGGRVQLRVLGRSETPMLNWRATVFATGNNLVVTGDTVRRVLKPRVESADERPEDRADWKHNPLRQWVANNRARLVTAGLTVLRAWHVAGRPRCGCKTWGSFEEWAAMIPPAISYAGGADPMGCRLSELNEEAPDKAALRTVLEMWPKLAPTGITIKTAIGILYPEDNRGHEPNDGFAALREALEVLAPTMTGKPPSTKRLGEAFHSLRGKVIGGNKLGSKLDRNGVKVWWSSAGTAGTCGDIPNPSRATCQTISRDTVEKVPATPSAPRTEDDCLPQEALFDGVDLDDF